MRDSATEIPLLFGESLESASMLLVTRGSWSTACCAADHRDMNAFRSAAHCSIWREYSGFSESTSFGSSADGTLSPSTATRVMMEFSTWTNDRSRRSWRYPVTCVGWRAMVSPFDGALFAIGTHLHGNGGSPGAEHLTFVPHEVSMSDSAVHLQLPSSHDGRSGNRTRQASRNQCGVNTSAASIHSLSAHTFRRRRQRTHR